MKYTHIEFAKSIREKHPTAYDDIDDSTLAVAYIEKHPVYKEQVFFEPSDPAPEMAPIAPIDTPIVSQDATAYQQQEPPIEQPFEQITPQPSIL